MRLRWTSCARLLVSVLLVAGVGACAPKARLAACTGCNVILISIDTLRADHLGCYGYDSDTTPSVDEFRNDAVLFSQAISHAPSTEPSHASMFTSLIPTHHGALRAKGKSIAEDLPTLPEILKEAGFATVSFNGGGQVAAVYGFDRGFDEYVSVTDNDRFEGKVRSAEEWLERNPGQRFFMFLHTYEIHAPYTPDAELLALFDGDYAGDLPPEISNGLLLKINGGSRKITASDLDHIVAAYDAELHSVDRAFGKLIVTLRERGLYDDTIIVFTSDHGEEFGEHGDVGAHSHTLYDELLHVPFIVKLPASAAAGERVDEMVRGIDLAPTVLELLGMEQPAEFQGTSLVPLLQGDELDPLVALSQIDSFDEVIPTSVRDESRKLIIAPQVLKDSRPYRWVRDEWTIDYPAKQVTLPLASADDQARVSVTVDGKVQSRAVLSKEPDRFVVRFLDRQGGRVTLRSLTPCVDPRSVGVEADEDCISFRVFNPFEFYRLDDDPGETRNLYGEPDHAPSIIEMRSELQRALSTRPRPESGDAELDPETEERLRSLGYID